MLGNLEHRLRQLDMTGSGSGAISIWYYQDDGTLLGPGGERITREAFFRRPSRRDVVVLSATDALL
jgi:hypothetical protein